LLKAIESAVNVHRMFSDCYCFKSNARLCSVFVQLKKWYYLWCCLHWYFIL